MIRPPGYVPISPGVCHNRVIRGNRNRRNARLNKKGDVWNYLVTDHMIRVFIGT